MDGPTGFQTEILQGARDARGLVFEPLDAAGLEAQKNVHAVLTEPGQVRGNHYHRLATEVVTVVGPALVRVRLSGSLHDFAVGPGEVRRFVIPPGVPHAIRHEGRQPGVLISFSTLPYDPGAPDTHRDVLLEPSAPSVGQAAAPAPVMPRLEAPP